MKIAMSCDHYGYPLKLWLKAWLEGRGHTVMDMGCEGVEPVATLLDDADKAFAAVVKGVADRAIVVCMSGGALAVRANKFDGLRAVVGWNADVVKHDREASDVNVLALAGHFVTPAEAERLVEVFLATPFEALERRVKRLARLAERPVV